MAAAHFKARLRNWLLGRKAYKFFLHDWLALGDLQRAADVMATMRFSQNLAPVTMEGPSADRITVLAPHPDDEIMGPGGTLIGALDGGAAVDVIYVTRGRDGTAGDTLCAEAQALASRLGYATRFLDFPLRGIPLDTDAVDRPAEAILANAPQALFVPFLLDDHDDHRRVSELLMRAAHNGRLSGNIEVWAYQVYTPLPGNVAVDITDVADRKADAIRGFASQMVIRDWAHWALGLNAFNSRFVSGGGQKRYIETFFVLPLAEYVELCRHYFESGDATIYREPAYAADR